MDFSSLVPGLAGGGVIGYVAGYGFKKLARIILTILGIIFAIDLGVLYWLQSQGVITITVNPVALQNIIQNGEGWAAGQATALGALATQIDAGLVGFAAGALLGWSRA